MLYYCKVDFVDKQYVAGPAPEFDRSMWLNEKFELGLDFPNLPYLIDEEVKITESMAILKYICAKWCPDLIISDAATHARAEMLSFHVTKLKETSTMPCYEGKSNQDIMNDCFPLIE